MQQYLDNLASASATPGGGSAAALTGAMGAALVSMACGLTLGKEKFAPVQAEVQAWLKEAEDLRGELMDLAQADARVFDDVMAAFRLPKETDEQKSIRNTTVQAALREATRVPLETVLACAGVVHLVTQVVDKINPAALSDAGTAAMLAQAGQRGACLNVKTNLAGIRDDQFVDQTWSRVEREAGETDRAAREIFSLCLSRMD